jgi:hypothetical protein
MNPINCAQPALSAFDSTNNFVFSYSRNRPRELVGAVAAPNRWQISE